MILTGFVLHKSKFIPKPLKTLGKYKHFMRKSCQFANCYHLFNTPLHTQKTEILTYNINDCFTNDYLCCTHLIGYKQLV